MAPSKLRLGSVRPLVRYVDEDQAVIDAHFRTVPHLPDLSDDARVGDVEVIVEVNGSDGFHDEGAAALRLHESAGSVRFDLVQPERWWPAGMGGQALYELTITLVSRDEAVDRRSLTFGMTSIRRDRLRDADLAPLLLVNGRVFEVGSIIPVDRADESALLPITSGSLVLVRDHYAPDRLYDAADRAGILLIQCVPIDPHGEPDRAVADQVDRLSGHPCLAGWFVGHLGRMSDRVAESIVKLDPTRVVFRRFPLLEAA